MIPEQIKKLIDKWSDSFNTRVLDVYELLELQDDIEGVSNLGFTDEMIFDLFKEAFEAKQKFEPKEK